VRRGLTLADYQRCHQGATSAFVPWFAKITVYTNVQRPRFGKIEGPETGEPRTAEPQKLSLSAYAVAKFECDQFLEKAAADQDFKLILLRPTILWVARRTPAW